MRGENVIDSKKQDRQTIMHGENVRDSQRQTEKDARREYDKQSKTCTQKRMRVENVIDSQI